MQLVKIQHDRVTIELNPRESYRLAEACAAAGAFLWGETDSEAGTSRRDWYEALAVALQAAALAAENEYHAGREGAPTLDYVRRRYSGHGERFPDLHDESGEEARKPPAA